MQDHLSLYTPECKELKTCKIGKPYEKSKSYYYESVSNEDTSSGAVGIYDKNDFDLQNVNFIGPKA